MCSMKRIMLFGLLLTLAYGVHAKPFYSYDLHGQVNGDVSGVTTLADVDMADEFVIRLNIWERNEGRHKVSFHGIIGGWAFSEQQTDAFYYWGPERFYTVGSYSPLNPPVGVDSVVYPNDLYLTMLGRDRSGTGPIPKENWLIWNSGEINLRQFHSGSFHFWFFSQDYVNGHSTEEDLFGSITRIIEVPEPATLLLSVLGLVFLLFKRLSRYPQ